MWENHISALVGSENLWTFYQPFLRIRKLKNPMCFILFVVRFGFTEPDRGDLDNEDIEWRHGKPDYTMANYQYLRWCWQYQLILPILTFGDMLASCSLLKGQILSMVAHWNVLYKGQNTKSLGWLFGDIGWESCEDLGVSGWFTKRLDWIYPKFATYICVLVLLLNI